jgi:hypothetical protein
MLSERFPLVILLASCERRQMVEVEDANAFGDRA